MGGYGGREMSHIVLLPFGSAGDVFPFLWIGKILKRRGHRVTMISSCLFQEAAGVAGIDFVSLGTEEEFLAIANDSRIWKTGTGTKAVLDYAVGWTERYLGAVEKLDRANLLMAPLTAFGARLAREKLGIPLITVHLQPMVFMSAYDTPLVHPALKWLGRLPVGLKRLLFSLPNPVDLLALPRIRKICAAHGVAPPASLWREWWNSPDGVLVLFPEWFAKPQPDWPENLFQWDFPMEDLGGEIVMNYGLEDFLGKAGKVLVFTPGSANVQAERFFETALQAVERLGVRAVFVTRMEIAIPREMLGRVRVEEFVPFGKLLKHASVFIHHGGIGTMSQGFRAGVPQMVMAMAHDQPDNADRLERLGSGIALTPRTFTPDRVEAGIRRLLGESAFREAAVKVSRRAVNEKDPLKLAQWIEQKAGGNEREIPPA